ncbi:MAG: hypothetical protein AAF809_10600 [Bacteroidota bacterium]
MDLGRPIWYTISKAPTSTRRAERQRAFVHSTRGDAFWAHTADG